MKKKQVFILITVLFISFIALYYVVHKHEEVQKDIKTTVVDKNGNKIKPIEQDSGMIGH